ncbi:acetyl-CoA carboxylase biotin carboxyl carrier protein subunit [Pelobium sp.]|nr:acetyl-CoA carboxylase biotin carboxyl carrier protein subunit [Pelobium sp.]MDA9555251.1 acetyl-CoA carboxylase biotin carboxyl carrier protein subunit [Pelobium sp.]
MYKINVNNRFAFETEVKNGQIHLNGVPLEIDKVTLGDNRVHLIHQDKSYSAEIIDFDSSQKQVKIKIGNNIYELSIKDQYDELLRNLGMDNLNASKIKEIKAPMPGLVLKLLANEGEEVKKGENLLVLEAMKMENMIKSPSDIVIKKILVKSGDKVEKNQVLIVLN